MGLKPSDILTREAFEDAITVTMALGGSHQCHPSLARDRSCG
ncbi:MAG: dihydroxy-acid dehydratase [Streptococcus sp.]